MICYPKAFSYPFFSTHCRNGRLHLTLRPFNLICIAAVTISLLRRYCYVRELSLRPKVDILFTGMWRYKSQPWRPHILIKDLALSCHVSFRAADSSDTAHHLREERVMYVRFYLPHASVLSPHSMLNNFHYLH